MRYNHLERQSYAQADDTASSVLADMLCVSADAKERDGLISVGGVRPASTSVTPVASPPLSFSSIS